MSKLPDLLQLAFTLQHVAALPDHKPDESVHTQFKRELSFAEPELDPSKVIVEFTLATDDDTAVNSPYQFRISCLVALQLPPPEPDDATDLREKAKLLGTQIATGAIRDHLATLTARAPWGVLILPPIVPMAPDELAQTK